MDNGKNVFRVALSSIFNAWPAFKIAIDNGVGGHDCLEKVNWLPGAVEGWMLENNDLEIDEIEDFIVELLDATFSLLIEDDSVPEVASSILRCYNLCREGRYAEVQDQFCNLKAPQVSVQVQQKASDDSESEEEMNTSESVPPLVPPPPPQEVSSASTSTPNGIVPMEQEAKTEKQNEDDDGWQEVKRGKGRQK